MRFKFGLLGLVVLIACGLFSRHPVLSRANGGLENSPGSYGRQRMPRATKSSAGRHDTRSGSRSAKAGESAPATDKPLNERSAISEFAIAGTPENDLCDNALPAFDGITEIDNRGAGTDGEPEPTCPFSSDDRDLNHDIWYDYFSSCSGQLTISLCQTLPTTQGGFDTKLAVYADLNCPPSGAPLACRDDSCPSPSRLASFVSFPTVANTPYKIRIGGYLHRAPMGIGMLNVLCEPEFPGCVTATGDCCTAHIENGCVDTGCCESLCAIQPECCETGWSQACADTAALVCGTCGGGDGNECSECSVVRSGVPIRGSTVGATGTDLSSCAGTFDTADVWHCWAADCTGTATLRVCDADFDSTLAVYEECAGTEVACDDDRFCSALDSSGSQVRFSAEEGRVYRIRVAGFAGDTGTYTLEARCDLGPTNDACENALPIQSGVMRFSTLDASTDGLPLDPICEEEPGLGVLLGLDIWYDYVAECSGTAVFSTCADADFDTRLAIYSDCDCPTENLRLAGCNDDGVGCEETLTSELSLSVAKGFCYKLRVGGYEDFSGAESGTGNITVSCLPPAAQDTCEETPITNLPNVFTGNNLGATDDCPELFRGRQVWIAFRLTEPSNVTLSYCGSDPTFLFAWANLTQSCPCLGRFREGANCQFCDDGNPIIQWFCLPAGVYYYPVDSERGSMGDYRIEVTRSPCVGNDACLAAFPLTDGTTVFSTQRMTTDGPAVPTHCNAVSPAGIDADIWYNYRATCTGNVEIKTCDLASFDTRLAMYEGTDCPINSSERFLGCNDNTDGCALDTSFLRVPVDRGSDYKLRVGGPRGETGVGCLDVVCIPSCPIGDITLETPPSGTTDARQSRGLGVEDAMLRGIDRAVVLAPSGTPLECFRICEPPGGALPANSVIEAVEVATGRYMLRFASPITPDAVTSLRYRGGTNLAEFIAHSGNANNDTQSNATDVSDLVLYLKEDEMAPWGEFSLDIDGSGQANILDVAALVNVLIGAGELDPADGNLKPAASMSCR